MRLYQRSVDEYGKLYWNTCDKSTIRYNDTVSQNTPIIPPGNLYTCFALNVPNIVIPLHLPSRDLDDGKRALPRSPMARVTFLLAFLISTALTHAGRYDIPVLSAEQLYPP